MPVIENCITEGCLTFTFPAGAESSKYDAWSHYRNQVNSAFGGAKAVDVVYAATNIAWLIEVKDYRKNPRTKTIELAEEVAQKVRDTLVGLVSARFHANNHDEKSLADKLLGKKELRVVLHLETPPSRSRLHLKSIDPDSVLHKLKQLIRAVDPHPCIVDRSSIHANMGWIVK